MKGFREKTISGISWKVVGQIGTQAIQFAVTVVLAHLLSPRDFGLVAMVVIVTNFAQVLSILGMAAVIQKAELSQDLLSSIFWLNVMVGTALALVLCAASPLIAWIFKEPALLGLTLLFAATFLVNSFGVTHNALLQREIDFRSFVLMDFAAYGVAGAAAIVLACKGYGVWSLPLQGIVFSLVYIAALWKLNPWRPGFTFQWRLVREIMNFSVNASLADSVEYWVRNVDNLLIGLFLGPGPLGIYTRAYAVMLVPVNKVARVLSDVMFASFSTIQDDRERVKSVFLKVTRAVALFTFPMMLGVLSIAKPFVFTVFGPQWSEMAPVLEVLCLIGMMQSVTMLIRNIYLSQGKADVRFRVELPLQLIQILGIVVGLKWGIMGVAVGYAAASVVVSYPGVVLAGRLIGLTYSEFLSNLYGVLACAAAMAAVVWGLPRVFPVEVVVGMIVYLGLLHVFRIEAYQEVKTVLVERLRR